MAQDKIAQNLEAGVLEQPSSVSQPEKEITPEQTVERPFEAPPTQEIEVKPLEQTGEVVAPVATPIKSAQQIREEQIDQILADGLEEAFLGLPPDKQAAFKTEGELTAKKINTLLSQAKVKLRKIVDLIRRWLSIIPGVNKFFLEQEAKIKADKIIKLKK
jgi:hypothetical protein